MVARYIFFAIAFLLTLHIGANVAFKPQWMILATGFGRQLNFGPEYGRFGFVTYADKLYLSFAPYAEFVELSGGSIEESESLIRRAIETSYPIYWKRSVDDEELGGPAGTTICGFGVPVWMIALIPVFVAFRFGNATNRARRISQEN